MVLLATNKHFSHNDGPHPMDTRKKRALLVEKLSRLQILTLCIHLVLLIRNIKTTANASKANAQNIPSKEVCVSRDCLEKDS